MTGDNIEEVAWQDSYAVYVFSCKSGVYENVFELLPSENSPKILLVDDLNANGTFEIFISRSGRRYVHTLQIWEWNGNEFASLIDISEDNLTTDRLVTTGFDYSIQETADNRLREFVVTASSPLSLYSQSNVVVLDQSKTIILKWDGQNYIVANQ